MASGRSTGIDWSPDGQVLFYAALTEGRHQIFAVPREGGPSVQLTRETVHVVMPAVSPDGTALAVTMYRHHRRFLEAVVR